MCQGGLDPKYGLRELEQSFKAARQGTVKTEENEQPRPRFAGWSGLLAYLGWTVAGQAR